MAAPDVRLTPAQRKQLLDAADHIRDHHRLLDRAERAGLEVGELRDQLNQAEALRQGLLAEFSPKLTRE